MVRLGASLRRAASSFREEPLDADVPPDPTTDLERGGGGGSSSSTHGVLVSARASDERLGQIRTDGVKKTALPSTPTSALKRTIGGGRSASGSSVRRSEAIRAERANRLVTKLGLGLGGSSPPLRRSSLTQPRRAAAKQSSPTPGGGGSNGKYRTVVARCSSSGSTKASTVVRPSFNDEDDRERLLAEKEDRAHDASEHGSLALFFLNVAASGKVFARHLITINTIFGVILTVAAILIVYRQSEKSGITRHGQMDWVLLGFAVVLPLSATVRFAFMRREGALRAIAEFKSNALHIYMAHASWDWDTVGVEGSGRGGGGGAQTTSTSRWLKHADAVFEELIGIGDELFRYLTLPTSSQGRHRVLRSGRREAAITAEASYLMFDSLLAIRAARLSRKADDLKRAGLPPTEASRIRQWERYVSKSIEEMRMIKSYRTPQALRSFANLFTLLLPPFYAASYVDLAYTVNSLTVGIMFGVITSIALTALYESVQVLEDPFTAHLSLDGIDVQEELCVLHWRQLVNARKVSFPSAPPLSFSAVLIRDDLVDEEKGAHKKKSKDLLSRSNMSHDRVSAFQHDLPHHQGEDMDSTFNKYAELSFRNPHHSPVVDQCSIQSLPSTGDTEQSTADNCRPNATAESPPLHDTTQDETASSKRNSPSAVTFNLAKKSAAIAARSSG